MKWDHEPLREAGMGHWGFWIEDFGFGANDQSNIQCSIPNPQWAGSWRGLHLTRGGDESA
jgi:hypothetical protein